MAHLSVTLAVEVRGLLVTWRLDDVAHDEDDVLAQLPLSIAGAPDASTSTVRPSRRRTRVDDSRWSRA